jgi:hypothetical protein
MPNAGQCCFCMCGHQMRGKVKFLEQNKNKQTKQKPQQHKSSHTKAIWVLKGQCASTWRASGFWAAILRYACHKQSLPKTIHFGSKEWTKPSYCPQALLLLKLVIKLLLLFHSNNKPRVNHLRRCNPVMDLCSIIQSGPLKGKGKDSCPQCGWCQGAIVKARGEVKKTIERRVGG